MIKIALIKGKKGGGMDPMRFKNLPNFETIDYLNGMLYKFWIIQFEDGTITCISLGVYNLTIPSHWSSS